uniref:NF-kappa-B inhibitor zeta-like n=2 Tax=Callorhinchus milii TaxID=7868 RepID=A0A4W3JF58_CALMI
MQDLVEILETDLKQARNHSFPTPLSPADRRPQDGIYSDRPLCLSSPLGQSDQGTLHSSLPEEHGRTRQGAPSSCESDSGQVSPVQSPGFGGEGYWSESDEDSFGQLAIPWDSAGSPSSSTTSSYSSSSSLLSPDENPPGFHVAFSECYKSYSPAAGSTKAASCSPQQGDLVESSGMTFFQFQLQQEESFLSNMSIHEILIPDTNGNTMLHKAVIQCKRALAYCLARKMASVGEIGVKDIRGQTALHLAAERNQHLMVGDFLSLGAQINERDCLGKTSVHLCAENGFLRVLEVIEDALMNGTVVDIEAADNNYLTPLHCAVLAHSAIVKDSECSKGNRDLDKFLRMRKEQLLDGMRCLLRMGASFLKQDMNGRNAIQFAQEENNREVLCFLQTQAESARITLRQDWRSYAPLDLMSKKVNGLKGQAPSRHYPN